MAVAYEAGEAYLAILPSTRGFAQRLKRELAGVQQDYTVPVQVDVDQRGLAGLRSALRALPAVVLDADATQADREVAALRARIESLAGQRIGIDISGAQARREVASIQNELDRLSRDSPDIAVRVDTGAASASVANVNREISRIDGKTARANIRLDGAAEAIAQVVQVGFAINQFANKKYSFSVDADTFGAVASISSLISKVAALGGLAGVLGGFGGALAGVGAAGAVAGAGLGATVIASLGVGKALSAMSAQQDSAASTARASAKEQSSSAFAIASAQDRVSQAYTNVGRVRQNVADDESRAALAVERAEENLASATTAARQRVAQAAQQASRAIASAEKQQAAAQRTLRQDTADLQREQAALTKAWEQGRRALQDLQDQVDGNALDQRQAALDLKDAKKELDAARASGDVDAIDRAQLAYDKQVETIDQLNKQTERLAADNAKAQAGGVAKSDAVVDANGRVQAAVERVENSTRAAGEADAAVDQARIDGAQSVAQARADGDRQIQQARQQLTDAETAATQQERKGREQLADANRQVTDAQRALTQALSQTGDAGASAGDKVAAAFADLSPAAAAFARYLFGLKPLLQELSGVAATAFFPPLQAGLQLLVDQAPLISQIVGTLAGAMGQGLNLVLTELASPVWMQFFALLASSSTTLIPALFAALMAVADAARVLITAFLPLAPAGLALVTQFAGLLTVLAPFIAQLLGGLIPAASAFLTALIPLGPVLAALQPILLVLGQALSTVLGAVLTALAPILVALTPLIEQFALTLATNLVGSIQTLQPFLLAIATWLGQNPGLVITVIGVIAGLVGAFKPLLVILGLAVSWLHSFLIIKLVQAALAAFGLQGSVVGGLLLKLLSPINLIKMALPLVIALVKRLGMAMLTAMGPIGFIITLLGILYTSNEAFRNAINGLLGVIGGLVGQLAGAFMPILTALSGVVSMLAGVFSGLVAQLASALIPIITVVAGVLTQLVGALLPPLMQIVGALVPVIVLLAGVFAKLLTGALAPLIIMFANLIATVLPPLISIMTSVLIPVIRFLADVLATVLTFVITKIVIPALSAIVPIIEWLGRTAMALWNDFLQPAFEGIGAVATWLWQNILKPVFTFIGDAALFMAQLIIALVVGPIVLAWQALGAAWQWVYDNILKPVIDFFAAAAQWLWVNVLTPIFAFITTAWNALGTAFVWVYDNILKPMFDGFAVVANWIWVNILEPIFGFIGRAWDGLATGFKWVYDNIIKPVFDVFAQVAQGFSDTFSRIVDGIGVIWNKIKEFFKAPVLFVLETVWEQGIGGLWAAAKSVFPIGDFPSARGAIDRIKAFRRGGPVRGPGGPTADKIPSLLSDNEHVITAREVAGAGGHDAVAKARAAWAAGIPVGAVDAQFAGGGPVLRRAAGGPVTWQEMWEIIRGNFPSARKTSDFRPGDPGYHGAGKGLDIAGPKSMDLPFMLKVNKWIGNRFPGSAELIHTQAGAINLKNGQPHTYNAQTQADHRNHVHWANNGGEGGSGGIVGTIQSYAQRLTDALAGPLDFVTKAVSGAWSGGTTMTEKFPRLAMDWAVGKAKDFLFGKASGLDAQAGAGAGIAGSGPVRDQVKGVARKYGWDIGTEWNALERLVQKESSWNPFAQNPISSAYGLFQFLNATWGQYGGQKTDNPGLQAEYGLRYISDRYQTPYKALAFHDRNNWYDLGGKAKGKGWMYKGTGADERMLPPVETQSYDTLTRLSQQLEAGRIQVTAGVSSQQIADMTRGGDGATTGGDTYVIHPSAKLDEVQTAREVSRIRQFNRRVGV